MFGKIFLVYTHSCLVHIHCTVQYKEEHSAVQLAVSWAGVPTQDSSLFLKKCVLGVIDMYDLALYIHPLTYAST